MTSDAGLCLKHKVSKCTHAMKTNVHVRLEGKQLLSTVTLWIDIMRPILSRSRSHDDSSFKQ